MIFLWQGTFALEWGGSTELHGMCMGPLLVLAMHVNAEKHLLTKLSYLAAIFTRPVSHASVRDKAVLRRNVLNLVSDLTQYNLQMNRCCIRLVGFRLSMLNCVRGMHIKT